MCRYCGDSTCCGDCWSALLARLQQLFCCFGVKYPKYSPVIDEELGADILHDTEISISDSEFDDGYKPGQINGFRVPDNEKIQLYDIETEYLDSDYDKDTGGYSENWTPKVGDIRQSGRMGNCWMLSALLTLISSGQTDAIKDCFVNYNTFLKDKFAKFKFFKLKFNYISWCNLFDLSANITVGGTVEIKIDNTCYKETNGSAIWVTLLEKAFAVYRTKGYISSANYFKNLLEESYDNTDHGKIDIKKVLNGGYACFCRAAITGKSEDHIQKFEINLCGNNELENLFIDCTKNNIPLSFGFRNSGSYINPKTNREQHIISGHAYSFCRYSSDDQYIFFIDPYKGDEQIILKLSDFHKLLTNTMIFGSKIYDRQNKKEHLE